MIEWLLSAISLTAKLAIGGFAWIIIFAIIGVILSLIVGILQKMGVINL